MAVPPVPPGGAVKPAPAAPHTLVLYHAGCYDGFGAAWAIRDAWGERVVRYQPQAHDQGWPGPGTPSIRTIVCADICPPEGVLKNWLERGLTVKVWDHHKSAEEAVARFRAKTEIDWLRFETVFDQTRSGAYIAYQETHAGPVPAFIQYLDDRDRWQFQLPHSEAVFAWVQSFPQEFDLWTKLVAWTQFDWEGVFAEAEAISRFKREEVKRVTPTRGWVVIDGLRVPAVNATSFVSEVAHALAAEVPTAPFVAYFTVTGRNVKWGLRTTRDDVDVSKIAARYGGGGLQKAAGFVTMIDTPPFSTFTTL